MHLSEPGSSSGESLNSDASDQGTINGRGDKYLGRDWNANDHEHAGQCQRRFESQFVTCIHFL